MFDEILACLDGSSLSENILPLARGLTPPKGGKLTLLRVVGDNAELSSEEPYLRDCARQYSARLELVIASDPATAIGAELKRNPRAIAALTTHGRTAWAEAILGSVALRVLRESRRPVILYRPLAGTGATPKNVTTIITALDGSPFSEQIIPYAVKAAQSLSAKLMLIQALPLQPPVSPLGTQQRTDINESSYLHWQAADIKSAYGVVPEWEVLHGEPADAICRYVKGIPEAMLAMTTHARGGLERAVIGSVSGACVRHAGIPLLLYWPHS